MLTAFFRISQAFHSVAMVHRGVKALVICGPSGVGKSSLLRRLFDDFPDRFGFSVSHTTRSARPGEIDGQHYHFTSKEEMEAAIQRGEFLESAVYSNNLYGTSKKSVEDVIRGGKICVLDIDCQGVRQMKISGIPAVYVFVKPPALSSLETRLRARGTETEETMQRRLLMSSIEIEFGDSPGNFDLVLVNDVLDKAYNTLKDFVSAELSKTSRTQQWFLKVLFPSVITLLLGLVPIFMLLVSFCAVQSA